jgi:hypothetical protein
MHKLQDGRLKYLYANRVTVAAVSSDLSLSVLTPSPRDKPLPTNERSSAFFFSNGSTIPSLCSSVGVIKCMSWIGWTWTSTGTAGAGNCTEACSSCGLLVACPWLPAQFGLGRAWLSAPVPDNLMKLLEVVQRRNWEVYKYKKALRHVLLSSMHVR